MNDVPSIPDRDDDRTLLRAWSRGGDESAFTQFVQRYLGMVQGSALRKTARPELAEEVAQAVFALAARRAATLAEHPCAGAWLHRTAVLESANALRRERKQRKIAAAMLVHPDTSPASGLPDAVLPHLDDALNALPEHDRRAVMLRYGERLSYDQMAARLGKSADACQKQTSRALDRLRGLLAGHSALPLTALAAGLTGALSTPATAAAGKVSAAAIAAAPGISLATVIHHLIHTMHTGKQIALATGAVALLAAVPLGLQYSEAGTLRDQLAGLSRVVSATTPVKASGTAAAASHEVPGSRIAPGVSAAEADRTVAMLRTLRGRMLTSVQLVDIGQQLMDLPLSHMPEALQAIADFPGIFPAMPLRLVIISRWAELDPDAALVSVAQNSKTDPFTGDLAKFSLATGWLERDPNGFALWLRDHPRHPMASALASMLGEKISVLGGYPVGTGAAPLIDRETVAQLRQVRPDGGYPGQLLIHWEANTEGGDPVGLAKKLHAEMNNDYDRRDLIRDVASGLSSEDPRAALEFVLAWPDSKGDVHQDALATVMDEWVKQDLDAAAAWAWSQKGTNETGANEVWKALSHKSEDEILAFLAKAPDESARLYSLRRTALESVNRFLSASSSLPGTWEPEKSLRLIARLPDEPRHEAMESFGEIRAGESLMKTSEWLLELPDGPDKNAAIRGFAPVLAQSEAESAMIWATSITEENQRTTLLQQLGQAWIQNAPDAARHWINSSEKLTDADRAAINAKPAAPASPTNH